jgi:hypothetical protein
VADLRYSRSPLAVVPALQLVEAWLPACGLVGGHKGFTDQNIGSRYLPTIFFPRWLCTHYHPNSTMKL